MFLDAHQDLNGLRDGMVVRLNKNTPRDFLPKACEVLRVTAGIAFYNDDVVSRDLMVDEYSLLPVAVHKTALYEGCRSASGWQHIGLATPPVSQLKTFEDVQQSFADQLEYFVSSGMKRAVVRDEVVAEIRPVPLFLATKVA